MSSCECFSDNFNQDHFLAGVDARVKLLVVFALIIMVLSYGGILFPLVIAAGSLAACLKMKVPYRLLLLRFAQPLFIAVVLLVLKLLFSGQEVLFSVNLFGLELVGHRDGLMAGLTIAARILGGVSLVIALGFATPFLQFVSALSWLRVPREFIEIMMFAYRYLFVFLEDGMTIYSAQKNRLGYVGVRKGLHSFGILTGSLVLRGFEQSQKTSEAMIQRGYTGDMPLIESVKFRVREVMMAMACVVCAGAIWIV